jgi:phage terminase large subunit
MKHGRTFYDLYKSDKRVVSNRGGTRSSKTYSVLEWLVDYAYHNRKRKKTIVSVVRKTLPALRGSSMRDFFEILEREKLYREADHDKTNSEYTLYNTLFEFIGTDQPQKVRGRKRNVLFCNEANELNLEDFRQLSLRTTDRIILDYNPSDFESWIYSEVETRPDCDLFVTTYKDNPFLDASIISEIERYKDIDPNYWRIYGQGQIGVPQ